LHPNTEEDVEIEKEVVTDTSAESQESDEHLGFCSWNRFKNAPGKCGSLVSSSSKARPYDKFVNRFTLPAPAEGQVIELGIELTC
jgi:hypothetical protein